MEIIISGTGPNITLRLEPECAAERVQILALDQDAKRVNADSRLKDDGALVLRVDSK